MRTSKPSARRMSARARKSSCPAPAPAVRLRRVISASTTGVPRSRTAGSLENSSIARWRRSSERQVRRGTEAAALDEDRLLVEDFRRLHDLAEPLRGMRRDPPAEPAAPALVASETASGDGIREGEEALALASLLAELAHELRELEGEHRLEALAADVALGSAVETVAHRHVVGGDRLGDGSRRTPGGEERAGDFLAAPDLGERAVRSSVEIERERLLSRRWSGSVHGFLAARSSRPGPPPSTPRGLRPGRGHDASCPGRPPTVAGVDAIEVRN